MSRLDEAINMITNMMNAIDGEIDRTNEQVQSRKLNREQLNDVSSHTATLLQIRSSLQTATGMINSGDIKNARWHKARRKHDRRTA